MKNNSNIKINLIYLTIKNKNYKIKIRFYLLELHNDDGSHKIIIKKIPEDRYINNICK